MQSPEHSTSRIRIVPVPGEAATIAIPSDTVDKSLSDSVTDGLGQYSGAPFRVLAIDGGGVRGLIPSRILSELESVSDQPIAALFDLIVGTSIGGIAALALTVAGPDGFPLYTPDSATKLLAGHKDAIFPSDDLSVPRTVAEAREIASTVARIGFAVTGRHRDRGNARYSPKPYETALSEFFGRAMLSSAVTPIVATAFDVLTDQPNHFRSVYASGRAGYDLSMATVARAVTAAPTFLPPVEVEWAGRRRVLVDGGVFANGASLLAYTEARIHAAAQGRSPEQILLVSLGTGQQHGSPDNTIDDFSRRHWVGLANRLMKAAEAGQHETHHRLLRQLLGDRYWRFQPVLPSDAVFGTDDTSDHQMAALETIADEFVATSRSRIQRLSELLVAAGQQHRAPAATSQ
ncbi:MAG: patatin-like phospholipase family protein [Acidimicrobiia bacterium]|nr:patatin-like phospholipase family protein [Acidimicrobiia bacterium]